MLLLLFSIVQIAVIGSCIGMSECVMCKTDDPSLKYVKSSCGHMYCEPCFNSDKMILINSNNCVACNLSISSREEFLERLIIIYEKIPTTTKLYPDERTFALQHEIQELKDAKRRSHCRGCWSDYNIKDYYDAIDGRPSELNVLPNGKFICSKCIGRPDNLKKCLICLHCLEEFSIDEFNKAKNNTSQILKTANCGHVYCIKCINHAMNGDVSNQCMSCNGKIVANPYRIHIPHYSDQYWHHFNGEISKWNVSNVSNVTSMSPSQMTSQYMKNESGTIRSTDDMPRNAIILTNALLKQILQDEKLCMSMWRTGKLFTIMEKSKPKNTKKHLSITQ
jgi:hypothetical protein